MEDLAALAVDVVHDREAERDAAPCLPGLAHFLHCTLYTTHSGHVLAGGVSQHGVTHATQEHHISPLTVHVTSANWADRFAGSPGRWGSQWSSRPAQQRQKRLQTRAAAAALPAARPCLRPQPPNLLLPPTASCPRPLAAAHEQVAGFVTSMVEPTTCTCSQRALQQPARC